MGLTRLQRGRITLHGEDMTRLPAWRRAHAGFGWVPQDTFRRLTFAQDTGSAIKGVARADIYFGHGENIPSIAGRIKQFGKFVMLVPRGVAVNGVSPEPAKGVPLPRPPQSIVAEAQAATTASVPAPQ